jgi:hypothetical protein
MIIKVNQNENKKISEELYRKYDYNRYLHYIIPRNETVTTELIHVQPHK